MAVYTGAAARVFRSVSLSTNFAACFEYTGREVVHLTVSQSQHIIIAIISMK